MTDRPTTQLDKFKQAARELECDDDAQRFRDKLTKLTKQTKKTRPELKAPDDSSHV